MTDDPGMVTCLKNGEEIERPLDRVEVARREGTMQRIPVIHPGERLEWVEGSDRPLIFDHEDF